MTTPNTLKHSMEQAVLDFAEGIAEAPTVPEPPLSRTETLIAYCCPGSLVWLMNSLVVNIVICTGTRQSSWQS